ncbi:hypothetical protein MC7420_1535 [Coleofasciculus chthonoplastes PCC 7420]|uniref:Uncharacterized protein n=1 Tax=Coleofasciculus chthonoplastes PCC 7420 TaxID=118168 RepID=B4W4V0_9CYAN|nr:hypothetical protein MC7420_1535 [Coleofasciculus chthonoplastes PCC 7420]
MVWVETWAIGFEASPLTILRAAAPPATVPPVIPELAIHLTGNGIWVDFA